MSEKIAVKLSARGEEVPVHYLPCSVQCEGGEEEGCLRARVEDYFVPTVREEEEGGGEKGECGVDCH